MAADPLSTIDLRRMRTVVEVARAEAITTAAQTLGLTQSAVSRTVAELEEALGQRLFDRLPRGIQLTEAGQVFVSRARQVLADVDDLVADISESSKHVTGRVRVGVSAIGFQATPALQEFVNRNQSVALETTHASDQTLCPKLMQGELDVVIGSANYLKRWRELDVTVLTPLYFACAFRPDHPLSERSEVTERDVLEYPLVLPEIIETSYSDIAQRYAFHGLPVLKPQYVTNNVDLIVHIVKTTDAFCPMMQPDETFAGLGEEFFLLRDVIQMPQHHLGYARARHRPRSRAVENFEQVLVDTLGVRGAQD